MDFSSFGVGSLAEDLGGHQLVTGDAFHSFDPVKTCCHPVEFSSSWLKVRVGLLHRANLTKQQPTQERADDLQENSDGHSHAKHPAMHSGR